MKLNLATKITIIRIFAVFPVVAIFIAGQFLKDNFVAYVSCMAVSAFLFALCCCTDFLDGYIARKTGTVSDLGKFLDPLADKVIVAVMLFLLVYFQDGMKLYVGGNPENVVFEHNALVITILSSIIIIRELAVSILRAVAASKRVVLAADIFGKVKTALINIAIVALMLAGTHYPIAWLGTIVFYAGAVLAVFSGIRYTVMNKKVFLPASDVQSTENAEDTKSEG